MGFFAIMLSLLISFISAPIYAHGTHLEAFKDPLLHIKEHLNEFASQTFIESKNKSKKLYENRFYQDVYKQGGSLIEHNNIINSVNP